MTFTLQLLIIWAVAAVVCLVGFRRMVYFISIGYGYSMAGIAIATAILFRNQLDALTLISCVLMFFTGARLGTYLLLRELKSNSYRNVLKEQTSSTDNANFFVLLMMWIACPALYVSLAAPLIFRLQNLAPADACLMVGIVISLIGIVLEMVADGQKTAAKKKDPHRWVDTGLYRMVRCPNYFGEMLIWTGFFVGGCTALKGAWQWAFCIAGYLCIVWIMFSGARRLELRQEKNYGSNPEFQKYAKSVPIILPLVPLYSVARYKWLVG